MDMNSVRPDSHVAQQSRRDKLRIQQCSTSFQPLEGFTQNSEHSSVNPDIIQVRNVRNANMLFDPNVVSSGIINFSSNTNIFSAPRLTMLQQDLSAVQPPMNRSVMVEDDLFTSLSHPVSPRFNAVSRAAGDLPGCSNNWKSVDSQSNTDWMDGYSAAMGREISQTPTSLTSNITTKYLKPSYGAYQDVQLNLTNPLSEMSTQYRQKRYGEMPYATPLYQDVTLASLGSQGLSVTSLVQQHTRETGHGTWTDCGNELALLPNYGNPSSALRYDTTNTWSNKPDVSCHQSEIRNIMSDNATQGLSLSLSSNPPSKLNVGQLGEGYDFQNIHSRSDVSKEEEDSRILKSGNPGLVTQPSIVSGGNGKSLQELVGTSSNNNYRTTGPLGPFTGYATILRSSRFLKPAQELLEEFCGIRGTKPVKTCDVSERVSREHNSVSVSAFGDAVDVTDRDTGAKDHSTSGVSSSTFYSSNQISCEGGVGSSTESSRPEYQQKKAKLLYLQEEVGSVCRRYKLYQQQMQMVVSAFEPVAGLGAATPYVSLAVKTISKNFRSLKNAISNQLKHVARALGEDLLSSATGTSTCRGDVDTSRLKYMDQCFDKQKSGGANMGFFEPQQPVWRPQRGLPERAVAVLRAWLFEHFLHPYPTDTDKHMLATQTGLSRNQVSNWFINARVRVWKPMVEEIYMLETNQKSKRSDGKSTNDNAGISNKIDQPTNRLGGISGMSNEQLDYTSIAGSSLGAQDAINVEQWNQEKRSRLDCQATPSVDRSLMSFIPYHQSGLEVGGHGAVSLTLGLRHGVENSQQQQEDQLRQQLGGHQMIHDFAG